MLQEDALAAPGTADHDGRLARIYVQVQVAQDRVAVERFTKIYYLYHIFISL